MKTTSLRFLTSMCALGSIFGQSNKTETLDISYTFSKVYVYNNSKQTISVNQNNIVEENYPEYNWGNQVMIGYTKKLKNSDFKFLSHLTGLHASYHFYHFMPQGSGEEILVKNQESFACFAHDGFYKRNENLNYFGLDLLCEATLKKTAHAEFYTQGGAIISWLFRHDVSKYASSDESFPDLETGTFETKRKDIFIGPNLKIGVHAPFYKKYFRANLQAGLGLLLDFSSLKYSKPLYNDVTSSTIQQANHTTNRYRFAPQIDIEASLSFDFHAIHITSGLNQMILMYNFNSGNFSSVIFGGPFIKASVDF